MISKGNHVEVMRIVLLTDLYIFTHYEINYLFFLLSCSFFFAQCKTKQL